MSNYLEQGKTFLEKKEYSKAMEYFQAAIEECSTNESAYLKLSEAYFKMGKEEQAKKTLFALLAINPNQKKAFSIIQNLNKKNIIATDTTDSSSLSSISSDDSSKQIRHNNDKGSQSPKIPIYKDPIVKIFPPNASIPLNKSTTPYWTVEQKSGNRFYFKIEQDYCILVYPNIKGNNWTRFAQPHGIYVIPEIVNIKGIDYKVKEIGNYALRGCEITGVIIPDAVTTIGDSAFSCCRYLSFVNMPKSVTKIGTYAFADTGLKIVDLPEGIKEIESHTFYNTNIVKIYIPENIKKIESHAFGPSGIEKIKCSGKPPIIYDDSFGAQNSHQKIKDRPKINVEVPSAFIWQLRHDSKWAKMNLIPY